jgi:hypothetical protein
MLNVSELVGFPPILQPLQWLGEWKEEKTRNKKQKKKINSSSDHHHVMRHRPSPCAGHLRDCLLSVVAAIAILVPSWSFGPYNLVNYCHYRHYGIS